MKSTFTMNYLPYADGIPINLLAGCFNRRSTTYKFYWFLSLIQFVEQGKEKIEKKNLFAQMIANSWYTLNYFHISFGVQDKFQAAIRSIREIEKINVQEKTEVVFKKLIESKNRETQQLLWHFNINVPHKFLSPWISADNQKVVYHFSQDFDNNCPYALFDDFVVINPKWKEYLQRNSKILKDFCYWNLILYLQSRNPNVPDIANKLIKSPQRTPLNEQRNVFWNIVLEEKGKIKCIYTGKDLIIGDYVVEHFIPYSFVSHDLIWNLLPADKSFNGSKSNKLPPLEKYFDAFYQIQREAVEIVVRKTPKNKFLQEYLTIFPNVESAKDLPAVFDRVRFKENFQSLVSIASNNGFMFLK
jgi:hypothetical protein